MKLTNQKKNPELHAFPSNLQEFIDDRTEFKALVGRAKRMLRSSLGRNYQGGVAIGKNYNTLILDIVKQGSDVYLNSNSQTITINGIIIENVRDFYNEVSKRYEIID